MHVVALLLFITLLPASLYPVSSFAPAEKSCGRKALLIEKPRSINCISPRNKGFADFSGAVLPNFH